MKQLTFSANNLNKQTPKQIQTIYRVAMLLSVIWVSVIQPNFEFSDHVIAEVNKWIVVFNGLFYHICQFFGWNDSTPDNSADTSTDKPSNTLMSIGVGLFILACITAALEGCTTPRKLLDKHDKIEALSRRKAGEPGSKRFAKYDTIKNHWCAVNAPVRIGKGKVTYLPGKPIIKEVPGPVKYVDCDSAIKANGGSAPKVEVPCPDTKTIVIRDTVLQRDTAYDDNAEKLLRAQLKGAQDDIVKAWDAASKANLRANAAEDKLRRRNWLTLIPWGIIALVAATLLYRKFR